LPDACQIFVFQTKSVCFVKEKQIEKEKNKERNKEGEGGEKKRKEKRWVNKTSKQANK
jgi:hypothetical protein